jgi:hypothetical protein
VALDLAPQQLAALMALHAAHLARVAVVREQCQALYALHQRGQAADYQQAGLQVTYATRNVQHDSLSCERCCMVLMIMYCQVMLRLPDMQQANAISTSAGAWLQHLESCLQLLQPLQIAHALVACWPWTPDVALIVAGAAGEWSHECNRLCSSHFAEQLC